MTNTLKTMAVSIAALIAGSVLASASSVNASSAVASSEACTQLAGLMLKNVKIDSATQLAEGAPVPNSGFLPMFGNAAVVGKAPAAMCRVVGHISPTAESDIGFEVWLPSNWDGRLHGIGIGGFAGVIDYYSLGSAVKAGQAGVATNTGHNGGMQEYRWAVGQPEKIRDYSWRAVHLSTVAAKKLVAAFYGRRPDKSYFVGCSGGGRQGLMQAARFPDDYDGVVAGAPAANFTKLGMALVNSIQAQNSPGAAIRPQQAKLLQEEVLKQCDGGDGQADGLIADPRQCRFDAAKLSCSVSNSPLCFSDPQVAALRKLQAGPRNSAGNQLAGGYLASGSEAGNPSPLLGWDGYLLRPESATPAGEGLADGILGALLPNPFATPADFDWDKHPAKLKAAAREIDAPANLSKFFARGGKLIIWHGWADAAIPPEDSLSYFDSLLRQSGKRAKENVRLFMAPGVQHCAGGLGAGSFGQSGAPVVGETPERNMVLALQQWREGSREAPESFVARRGMGGFFGSAQQGPERQRRLCAWPKHEVFKSGGDPDKAESYSCE